MPDLAHHSLKLRGCLFCAAAHCGGRNFPPVLWHLFCERVEFFVDFLSRREGVRGVTLIASEDEAGDMAEVLMIEVFD